MDPRQQVIAGPGDALVVLDVQQDFLPGGALGATGGEQVIRPLNHCMHVFAKRGLPVFATRYWHPPDHRSFATHGGSWPPHCVAESVGASFPPELGFPHQAIVVSKATVADDERHSPFECTDLEAQLRKAGVQRLFIGGLGTVHCVLKTSLDARAAGFDVTVLRDAIAPVETRPGEGERALGRLLEAGAQLIDSKAVG